MKVFAFKENQKERLVKSILTLKKCILYIWNTYILLYVTNYKTNYVKTVNEIATFKKIANSLNTKLSNNN